MGPAELHPVLGFAGVWTAGWIFLGLLTLLLLTLPLFRKLVNPDRNQLGAVPIPVRKTYLGKIDRIAADVAAGECDRKDGAQELAGVVKDFAHDAWKIDTTTKTLRELRQERLVPVARVVDRLYAAQFTAAEDSDVTGLDAELAAARELVGRWS